MYNPFIPVINSLLPEPQASLLAGMLFGIKANFSRELYNALIATGTIHIVALSGQNISILATIISVCTSFLRRKISILINILLIVAFVIFVGPQPPVVRAAIMGVLTFSSTYFGRKSWGLLSLILSSLVMIIVMPAWLFELSFQLSVAATFGIILLVPKVQNKKRSLFGELLYDFKMSLWTTLAAQIFTLPIIFMVFRRISLIAPLTNMLIGPLVAPIMVLGLCVVAFGSISSLLALPFVWSSWALLSVLIWIVEVTARIPFASIVF